MVTDNGWGLTVGVEGQGRGEKWGKVRATVTEQIFFKKEKDGIFPKI